MSSLFIELGELTMPPKKTDNDIAQQLAELNDRVAKLEARIERAVILDENVIDGGEAVVFRRTCFAPANKPQTYETKKAGGKRAANRLPKLGK
jgi:hypothetical protein